MIFLIQILSPITLLGGLLYCNTHLFGCLRASGFIFRVFVANAKKIILKARGDIWLTIIG